MEIYKNISAIDWLKNDTILDINLHEYKLNTKKTNRLVYTTEKYYLLSPNKKYLLDYTSKKNVVMNVATKKKIDVPITEDLASISWIDNQNLIFATITGKIHMMNINGTITTINHILKRDDFPLSDISNFQLVKVQDQFFYLEEDNLMVWNSKTKEKKTLMDSVSTFVLSPNKKYLAVKKLTSIKKQKDWPFGIIEATETLMVMDLFGKIRSTVATAPFITSTCWSEDSTKIAYMVTKSSATEQTELFVSDLKNGHPSMLAVNIPGGVMAWSPSNNKLLINSIYYSQANSEPSPVLYVVTIKS
ncbi:hypothetical protein [Shimazuella kribbensis]|uniref:hypothetical protein n=1 Tax=Shimazuella kribbensis TaxID=139808 RepID=UPI00147221E8|nr:hypothetical protein [Shimazuella kribbensis]